MLDILKKSAIHNKIRHQAWECMEKDDFDGFCKYLTKYINKGWPDKNKMSKIRAAVHTLDNWIINSAQYQDRLIDYMYRGNFASKPILLMSYWTHPQNERLSRQFGDKPHEKYKELWEKGFSVTSDQYSAFCEIFNKDSYFKEAKENFLQEQNKYIISHTLEKDLKIKTTDKPKNKI